MWSVPDSGIGVVIEPVIVNFSGSLYEGDRMVSNRLIRWNMALGLAGVLALAGLGSSCKSSNSTTSTGSNSAVPTQAVADVVEDGSQDRVARVADIEGQVSLLPVDADDWETADVNEPVLEGYKVYAADNSRGELMLGDGKYARFGDGATFTVARLDPAYAQVELERGSFAYTLDRWTDNDYYEIS